MRRVRARIFPPKYFTIFDGFIAVANTIFFIFMMEESLSQIITPFPHTSTNIPFPHTSTLSVQLMD